MCERQGMNRIFRGTFSSVKNITSVQWSTLGLPSGFWLERTSKIGRWMIYCLTGKHACHAVWLSRGNWFCGLLLVLEALFGAVEEMCQYCFPILWA